MFTIEKRVTRDNTVGNWFPIWESRDGHDTADYLKQCVEVDSERIGIEYRMRYIIKSS